MSTDTRRGFTIIEVMLFLAITGALAVGILVASSATIGQQRYRDSVSSLKSFIQEQYGEITSVINTDASKPVCNKMGSNISFDTAHQQARGTSECLILGKFLLIEPTTLTAYDVIGQSDTQTSDSDDTAVLKNYTLATTNPETKDVDWDAKIVKPKTSTGLTLSVLMLRSPLSGSIMTYVREGNQRPAVMLNNANMVQADMCVDSQGLSGMGHRLAVRIAAGASGQSSIEIPSEKDGVCD